MRVPLRSLSVPLMKAALLPSLPDRQANASYPLSMLRAHWPLCHPRWSERAVVWRAYLRAACESLSVGYGAKVVPRKIERKIKFILFYRKLAKGLEFLITTLELVLDSFLLLHRVSV